MAQFAVIGLGRFGSAASLELMRMGHSVLGIDNDPKIVDKYADHLSRAVIADVTDSAAVQELGLDNYDVVLIAIGDDVQASLVSVVHLKAVGVTKIWVKAISHAQHLILHKLGVNRIIHPEEEMGVRVAQMLSYPMVNDYISLGNGEFVVEITASERLDEISLGEVLHQDNKTVEVLLIKRKTQILVRPTDDFILQAKDILVIFGPLQALRNIAPKLI
ncbi:MAG TPA: TrkA family potassium uptake protein [Paenalcaligenes hominis]|uniref:Trk system potassium uptake protein TrkA n=1 Tax=Paenalcaligenes hominis TaxID=643674 RepID=A0A9D2VEZ0_9BURK|nr:TrkA family potassium uptake protein [Paenalcaligenes hominis]NJB64562.1 trk system potassium uptake protein TrkA [Paenalcaligenes hominis]GGE66597.1 potassium transporter TrkA [Paenalcaligenes hominis]HJH23310.1 TrkA family potassium uptake protein [Paenalcaligenes hominis]